MKNKLNKEFIIDISKFRIMKNQNNLIQIINLLLMNNKILHNNNLAKNLNQNKFY